MIVSGTVTSRTCGPAACGDLVAFLVAVAMTDLRLAPAARRARARGVAAASLSARLRAASSENTWPGAFFVGSSRFSPGFAAGRCSVPSFTAGAFAGASLRLGLGRLRAQLRPRPRPSPRPPRLPCAIVRCASRSCFALTSACWRAISSCACGASSSRAARSFCGDDAKPGSRARLAPRAALRRRAARSPARGSTITGFGHDDLRRAARLTGSGAATAGAGASSSRRTSTRFLRTSTWIVRALPLESAALISLVCLRVSVMRFFGSAARRAACAGSRAGASCPAR